MARTASPLKVPCFLASTTVPVACAPFGMAVRPPTITGSATVASNSSPGLATLELMVLVKTTVIGVSAGTTIGRGGSGAGFCASADWVAPCWLLSVDGLVEVSPLLQPAASPSVAASPSIAHLLFIVPPHFFLNVNLVKRRRSGDCLAWVSAGLRGLRYFEYYHLSRRLSREGTRVYRKRFIVGSFS